jgi:hypothetical protein
MLEPAGVGRAICTILSSRSPRMDWLDVSGGRWGTFTSSTVLVARTRRPGARLPPSRPGVNLAGLTRPASLPFSGLNLNLNLLVENGLRLRSEASLDLAPSPSGPWHVVAPTPLREVGARAATAS